MSAVTTRALSDRQARTRRTVIDAALALARRRSLADFGMRDVAREAGVSPATAYTYFASKEHLLAEVYAEWVGELTGRLRARPPSGADALARVRSVIRRATEGVSRSTELADAFTRAMASSDPTVALIRPTVRSAFAEWLDIAIADEEVHDRDAVVRTLELTMYGAMIARTHGTMTVAAMRDALDDAARLLLAPERR